MTRVLVDIADEELTRLRLRRSGEKTTFFDTPQEARAAIEDDLLASAFGWFEIDQEIALARIYDVFDSVAEAPVDKRNLTRFRAALKTLINKDDRYAAAELAGNLSLANVDPALVGQYLGIVALEETSITDAMFSKLEEAPEEKYGALDLHYLRAFSQRRWGEAEGKALLRIAIDEARRPPVRCWAWHAASETTSWRAHEAEAAAESESDPMVRRSIVSTLRRSQSERGRERFLQHICRHYPRLRYTARWIEADSSSRHLAGEVRSRWTQNGRNWAR